MAFNYPRTALCFYGRSIGQNREATNFASSWLVSQKLCWRTSLSCAREYHSFYDIYSSSSTIECARLACPFLRKLLNWCYTKNDFGCYEPLRSRMLLTLARELMAKFDLGLAHCREHSPRPAAESVCQCVFLMAQTHSRTRHSAAFLGYKMFQVAPRAMRATSLIFHSPVCLMCLSWKHSTSITRVFQRRTCEMESLIEGGRKTNAYTRMHLRHLT